jgi:hypothetical protein
MIKSSIKVSYKLSKTISGLYTQRSSVVNCQCHYQLGMFILTIFRYVFQVFSVNIAALYGHRHEAD